MRIPSLRAPLGVAVAAATVTTAVVAFGLPRDFSVGNFVDDAHYAVLSKSIREHGSYRTLNVPGQPFETKYPPGFPLLLAAAWSPDRSDLDNLDRSRWVNLILVGPLAGILTLFGATVLGLNPLVAAGLSVAGLTAPVVVTLWTVPLSGALFLMCLVLGFLTHNKLRPGWRMLGFAAAVYVRTVAGAFAVAALITTWLRNDAGRFRDAAFLTAALLPWLLWQVVNRDAVPDALLGLYGSYGRWYLDSLVADPMTVLVRVPLVNARDAVVALGTNLLGGQWLPVVLRGGLGLLIAWRLWILRREFPSLALGVAVYGVVLLLWPFPPDRFIAGLWPVLVVILGATLRRHAWVLAVVLLVVSAVTLVRGDAVRPHRNRSQTTEQLVRRADSFVVPGDVLASTNAALYYLRYGVSSVPVQRMRSYRRYRLGYWSTAWGLGDDVWAIVERYGVTKAMVEARGVEGRFAVGSLMGQCPAVVEQVWEGDAGMLFLVHPREACELGR